PSAPSHRAAPAHGSGVLRAAARRDRHARPRQRSERRDRRHARVPLHGMAQAGARAPANAGCDATRWAHGRKGEGWMKKRRKKDPPVVVSVTSMAPLSRIRTTERERAQFVVSPDGTITVSIPICRAEKNIT